MRDAAGVPGTALGLTGSLLFDLHAADSDIDLVVYGDGECRKVHAALTRLLDDPSSALRRPRGKELVAIHAMHREDTPLSAADFARLQAGKVNEGRFAGRPYFVRFVKLPAEVPERYGDPRFAPAGRALVEARVVDDRDALFTPCRYGLREPRFLEGPHVADLGEVVSFRGRFADQARSARGCARAELWSASSGASAPRRRASWWAAGPATSCWGSRATEPGRLAGVSTLSIDATSKVPGEDVAGPQW